MPWCEECAKYWTPNSVGDDGACPRCGDLLVEPVGPDRRTTAPGAERQAAGTLDDERAPWHFKLLIVATTGYLVWRFVQIFT